MATIRSVPPSATMRNGSKHLQNLLHNPLKLEPQHYKYSMDTYVELSVKKGTRRRHGDKPDTRTFISNLQQVMLQGDKWLNLLSNSENKLQPQMPKMLIFSRTLSKLQI